MTRDFSLAFCPVTSMFDDAHFITKNERKLLGEKTTPKRIGDFIAGRIAAKHAVRSYLSLPEHIRLSILRTEQGEEAGRPYVVSDEAYILPLVHLSITHADKKAYAVASRSRIGIDNVTIEPYSSAFVEEVFQIGELKAWADWLGVELSHPLAVCSGFAAKEAFLKWMGVGLRYSLPMVQLTPFYKEQSMQQPSFFQKQFFAACCIHNRTGDDPEWIMLDGFFSLRNSQIIILLTGDSPFSRSRSDHVIDK
ncbi:4'-phosphopantetheinyl transferase superfamily protein [Ectobacillus panaciterrae]|uniref:4'-phosphopantetheinyl transferase superfamily protein n=1 Tax=Ectobacillus panaciterrae TaxID=363872 RepID=UPI000419C87B|nr:4'-phosphopantetheinyl transferase superfamily protein [Ectobacillus panaciterrae]